MNNYTNNSSLMVAWLVVLAALAAFAVATGAAVAWTGLAAVGLMPPLALRVLGQTPRSMTEIIRDTESDSI